MKRKEQILTLIRQLDLKQIPNDGPTALLFKMGSRKKSVFLSADDRSVTVMVGRFPFRHRFYFRRDEL